MRQSAGWIARLSVNPWLVFVGTLCSIIGLGFFFYEKFDKDYTKLENVKRIFESTSEQLADPGRLGLLLAIGVLGYLILFTIVVRFENRALRQMAEVFFEINRIYRQELQRSFVTSDPITNAGQLIERELQTLHAVCERVADIFSLAVRRRCVVTVKLLQPRGGVLCAQTYTRSLSKCMRDEPARSWFEFNTGKNLAMDECVEKPSDSLPSHFASRDLKKYGGYTNERMDYYSHYKSIIVVPIRGESSNDGVRETRDDLIGFLSVDTKSRNRLGDKHHIYMLAALSNQMYNFICLMRGRYTVIL